MVQKRIEGREDRLLEVLRLVHLAGDSGMDERRLVGQVERVLRVSARTATSYVTDVRIRGWARVAYGNVKVLPSGAAELEERKRQEELA
jgi:hypothetical protein